MRMRGMITIAGIVVVVCVAWWLWKKYAKNALIAKLSEKLGDIPGLADKSIEELQSMWDSTKKQ